MSAAGGAQRVSAWNLPNILTSVRILMVPFFAWALWVGGPWGGDSLVARWLALALFAAAMYTDKLDGDIARARGLITDFGKIADPIADKLLTGTALVLFSLLGELWWWVTIVILVREWGITLMRFVVIRYGVMPAGRGGKLKTVLQTVGIGLPLGPGRGRLVAVGRLGGHRGRHRADGADRPGVRQGRVGPAAGRPRRPAGGLRR